jgi:hypothetical protein
VHQVCLRGERYRQITVKCRKREKQLESRSRSREHPRLSISLNNFPRKGRVKTQVRPPTFLSSTFLLFFFIWVIFYCLSQAFFLSRHSRFLSSFYRSYRRILEASYLERSAQAQSSPPELTLTGVPESSFRQRLAPQQLRSELFNS